MQRFGEWTHKGFTSAVDDKGNQDRGRLDCTLGSILHHMTALYTSQRSFSLRSSNSGSQWSKTRLLRLTLCCIQ